MYACTTVGVMILCESKEINANTYTYGAPIEDDSRVTKRIVPDNKNSYFYIKSRIVRRAREREGEREAERE